MEMNSKYIYTSTTEKQDMQKQLGCMNGIFQLFDRHHFVGKRTNNNLKKLPPATGQNDNRGIELSSAADKTPVQQSNLKEIATARIPVDPSRTSISSCSSSIFSSVDIKTTQPDYNIQSPVLTKNKPKSSPKSGSPFLDFRDVVKDSMHREARGVSVKKVAQNQGKKNHVMKHIDSPRPALRWNTIEENRSNSLPLASPRFSYDERESRNKLKSNAKLKELPRLSLDSKVRSIRNSSQGQNGKPIEILTLTNQEPGSNKRPSSLVAKLMGLDALPDPGLSDDISKENQILGPNSATKQNSSPRFPLEPAPWSQFKKNQSSAPSVYSEIEKRLKEIEFKKSGKDLRALKQILEAMQKTRARMEPREAEDDTLTVDSLKSQCSSNSKLLTHQSQHSKNPVSPTVKGMRSPKRQGSATVIRKPSEYSDITPRKNHLRDPSCESPVFMDKKIKSRTVRASVPSKVPQRMVEKPAGLKHKQSRLTNPPLELTRVKSQPSKQPVDNTRKQKPKYTTPQVNAEVRSLDHSNVMKNFSVRMNEDKSLSEFAITTVEQPSPVSVLDAAFYGDDSPSPVKKISYAFKDFETPDCNEAELNGMDKHELQSYTRTLFKLEEFTNSAHRIRSLNVLSDESALYDTTTADHKYISEILLASGLLKDLASTITTMQLHSSSNLINPDLFHILEKIKGSTEFSNEKRQSEKLYRSNHSARIQRKLVFDTVNEILVQKLALHNKPAARIPKADKLITEVFSEIDHLNSNRDCNLDNEDDDLSNILTEDMMNKSDDWGNYKGEVPSLVLDIERLIFKDLISEIVSGGALLL